MKLFLKIIADNILQWSLRLNSSVNNLSSKLPVADKTREVWGRKCCWWCLGSDFPLSKFLPGFTYSFRFGIQAPLLMRPRHFAWSYAICSHDSVGMLKSLRKALRMSLYCFFWPPWEHFPIYSSPKRIFFGKHSLGILVTWTVHLNSANFRRVCTLCITALFRTSASGIMSCHLIFRDFLRQLEWKWFSLLACCW